MAGAVLVVQSGLGTRPPPDRSNRYVSEMGTPGLPQTGRWSAGRSSLSLCPGAGIVSQLIDADRMPGA